MRNPFKHVPVGRRWGYTGLVVGFIASISFNMADAHMEKRGQLGPLLLAPQAPLILFVSLEILTRTQWKKKSKGVWAARVSVAGVALISGITSYLHLHNLLQEWDPGLPAVIFPLAIDLLMVGGAASLLASTDTDSNFEPEELESPSDIPTSVATETTSTSSTEVQSTSPRAVGKGDGIDPAWVRQAVRDIEAGQPPSLRTLKARHRIGEPKAREILAAAQAKVDARRVIPMAGAR